MAKVINNFTSGRMDSDTHYSLLENKDYVRSENLRIIGEGDDGSLKNLRGSLEVSNYSENKQMTVIGHYEGLNNKSFYFLAQPNGKSKIIEYDVETRISRVIIQDTTVLRFDLIRWDKGQVILPLKFLLSINQVGDLLIFSHEVWRNIRCVNVSRLQDYASGFSEEDIMLAKKPPFQEPKILSLYNDPKLNDESRKDKFISFAYRFKYKDGDYSSLSFFSKVAFQTKDVSQFAINAERENLAMVNKTNAVKLLVYSGGKDVTDIEVYAREHNNGSTYLIFSFNKANNNNYGNNILLPEITYTYSNNYKVLPKDDANLIYNNVPTFPKAQDVAGNRVFFGNYKEGYDLGDAAKIQMDLKITYEQPTVNNNESVVSLFSNKVGVVYYDDYNVSTTVLGNQNQELNEILIPFERRFTKNSIKAKLINQPPAWATKFKFVVNSQELTYEIIYITLAKKLGSKIYLFLSGDNLNRVKKGDILTRIDSLETTPMEYKVSDVKQYGTNDGLTITGTYVLIESDTPFPVNGNGASNVSMSYKMWNDDGGVIDAVNGSTDSRRFDSTSGYQGNGMSGDYYESALNKTRLKKSDYGTIFEGDTVRVSIRFHYSLDTKGRGDGSHPADMGSITVAKEMYASKNYPSIYELLIEQFQYSYLNISPGANDIWIGTNREYIDIVQASGIQAYSINPHQTSAGRNRRLLVQVFNDINVTRGIKPVIFRTRNLELQSDFYFETPNTFRIQNGQHVGAGTDGYFDTGFHNCYCWGNGIESYKIKDAFNAKKLRYDFRPNAVEIKGYKQVHRKFDITYSGIFNYDLGINNLSEFNATLANWITLPINYGEIQRLISLGGNITACLTNKFIDVFYEKSIIADMQGIETVALSDKVLGGYKALDYEYGVSYNPESVVKSGNAIMAVDKNRSRFLLKQGFEVQELNAATTGFHKEGIELLETYDSFQAVYDDAHGEYIVSLNNERSISFSLMTKGFVNYYTYKSDFLFSMNGKPFVSYKGILYQNEVTENYSNFAGQGTMPVKVVYVVNPEIDSDKVFKAMYLQSNTPWNTKIRTNYTESEITESLYEKKESFYYTNCFRNISGYNTSAGLGIIKSINLNIVEFGRNFDNNISVGDFLMLENSITEYEILEINGNSLTLSNAIGLTAGSFAFAIKKYVGGYRPDGDPIRGKWMEITLEKMTNESIYITSASTEIIKSYL